VSEIGETVRELAFQTNILAPNAAVEASRAGESGRAFAVVAAEVRALASRSAGAAREIGDLIAAAVRDIESSTQAASAPATQAASAGESSWPRRRRSPAPSPPSS
jgi:methyl-accepting chemotaxis protein